MNTRFMNTRLVKSPRFNAIGLAVGSIVALILAMAVSFSYDIQPIEDSINVNVALADSIHN